MDAKNIKLPIRKVNMCELNRRRLMDSDDRLEEVSRKRPRELSSELSGCRQPDEDFTTDPLHNTNVMEERSDDEEPTESDNDFIDDESIASLITDCSSWEEEENGQLRAEVDDLRNTLLEMTETIKDLSRRLRTVENS